MCRLYCLEDCSTPAALHLVTGRGKTQQNGGIYLSNYAIYSKQRFCIYCEGPRACCWPALWLMHGRACRSNGLHANRLVGISFGILHPWPSAFLPSKTQTEEWEPMNDFTLSCYGTGRESIVSLHLCIALLRSFWKQKDLGSGDFLLPPTSLSIFSLFHRKEVWWV